MALLFKPDTVDGIQFANNLDQCYICDSKRIHRQPGELEGQEVFIIHYNGMRRCICMDCFNAMLGKYTLVENKGAETTNEDKTA